MGSYGHSAPFGMGLILPFFQEMETATVPKPANLALPFLVCSMTQAIS